MQQKHVLKVFPKITLTQHQYKFMIRKPVYLQYDGDDDLSGGDLNGVLFFCVLQQSPCGYCWFLCFYDHDVFVVADGRILLHRMAYCDGLNVVGWMNVHTNVNDGLDNVRSGTPSY